MGNLTERSQQGLFHFDGHAVKIVIGSEGIFLPEHPDLFVQFADQRIARAGECVNA
jgi:hypothetical protein